LLDTNAWISDALKRVTRDGIESIVIEQPKTVTNKILSPPACASLRRGPVPVVAS
jgi:hypothetical protein